MPRGIGIGIGRNFPKGGGGGGGTTNVALTLTWTSGTGALTPTFTLSGAILVDDSCTLSLYSDAGLTTLVDSDTQVAQAANFLSGTIDFPGIGALSAGTYWARATLSATGRTGTSNTETKTLVSFSVSDLYTGGERGLWISGADTSKMFQNSGGTGAVSADGDPIGYYLDKSGNGIVITQNNASNKPLYKTSGGLHWIEGDSSDTLEAANVNIAQNTGFLTVAMAVHYTSLATFINFFQACPGGAPFNSRATITFNSSDGVYLQGRTADGDSDDAASPATSSIAGAPIIIIAEFDYTNADGRIYLGQTLALNDTSFMVAGTTSNTTGYFYFAPQGCKLYELVAVNRQLTTDEKSGLGNYLATMSGATY